MQQETKIKQKTSTSISLSEKQNLAFSLLNDPQIVELDYGGVS